MHPIDHCRSKMEIFKPLYALQHLRSQGKSGPQSYSDSGICFRPSQCPTFKQISLSNHPKDKLVLVFKQVAINTLKDLHKNYN